MIEQSNDAIVVLAPTMLEVPIEKQQAKRRQCQAHGGKSDLEWEDIY